MCNTPYKMPPHKTNIVCKDDVLRPVKTNTTSRKKQNKKRVSFNSEVQVGEAVSYFDESSQYNDELEKGMRWYNGDDYDRFSMYNQDLVMPLVERDILMSDPAYFDEVESIYSANGHSLRGLERFRGMPLSDIRAQHRYTAIVGTLEAWEMFHDSNQVGVVAQKLNAFAASLAYKRAQIDCEAVEWYLDDIRTWYEASYRQSHNNDDNCCESVISGLTSEDWSAIVVEEQRKSKNRHPRSRSPSVGKRVSGTMRKLIDSITGKSKQPVTKVQA